MKPVTTAAPAVTLAEAKAQVNAVEFDDDDALLQGYILKAQKHLEGPEGRLRRQVMPQTWEMALDAFPAAEIRLPYGPTISVVSVKYTDPEGATQTVPADAYVVDTYADPGWIVPYAGWPAAMATINAVRVQWVAGMGEDCPEDIKHAILLLVAHFYRNREAAGEQVHETPLAVDDLIHIRKRIVMA